MNTPLRIAAALTLVLPAVSFAQEEQKTPVEKILGKSESLAFVDVDVFVGDGKKLEKVTVLVEDGKIQKIGKGLTVPRSARRIDGGVLTPGFVLLGSTAGVTSSRRSAPSGNVIVIRGRRGRMRRMPTRSSSRGPTFSPNVKIATKIDPKSQAFADWLKAGVTTHGVRPPADGLSGIGAVARAHGEDRDSMVVNDDSFLWLGMSSNTKSKKSVREGFAKAKELIETRKKAKTAKPAAKPASTTKKPAVKPAATTKKPAEKGKTPPKPTPTPKPGEKPKQDPKKPAPKTTQKPSTKTPTKKPTAPKEDPRYATLARSLEGKLGVMLGVQGAKDLLHAAHALEGHKMPLIVYHPFRRGASDTLDHAIPLLKKLEAKVVVPAELGSKDATQILTNPVARLQKAGIDVTLVPATSSSGMRDVWTRLNELLRAGAKAEKLIEGLTLAPAKLLGVDKRVGSIAPGKDANFLHFSRNPFSPAARLHHVYFEGREVENTKARSGS